ncbi:MAG: hypothetical protein RMK29_00720 [Myxococcales bacterium]|nr:hypothetical protein [Myxococcota bacterium]MDW8280200.1 hypothetical protein [Myxococcales bacterium]
MGIASLILGILSIVFGVLPLLPLGGPATLVLAALGLPFGAVGVCLGLLSRSEAMLLRRSIGLHTAALSSAVVGTLVCAAWVGGLVYAQHKVRQAAQQCLRSPQDCVHIHLPRLSLTPSLAAPASGAGATSSAPSSPSRVQ